jgi:hypothetical protein
MKESSKEKFKKAPIKSKNYSMLAKRFYWEPTNIPTKKTV